MNARYGVKSVRVDSGGVLNGVLLRAGLVDEVSVLVQPCLVGGTTTRSLFVAPDLAATEGVVRLKLAHVEPVRDDALWLRYKVVKQLN
jgi:2,5-diamino-6-(ribosylamino)-4(3H)-pyrimidinone 5'-phosphate reductase